jgi:hypothetical protein
MTNMTYPLTEITFECPSCKKKSKLVSKAKSDIFTVRCYYCKHETDVKCITSQGQLKIVPHTYETFQKIELPIFNDEKPVEKSPSAYKLTNSYTAINLENTEDSIETIRGTEILPIVPPSKTSFFQALKEDLVTMLNIQTIETSSHVPIFGIVKQKKKEE